MALTNNPNLSRGIEKRWRKEINKRWSKFTRIVLPRLKVDESFRLNVTDQEQAAIDQYMVFFESAILTILLADDWQNKYQTDIYTKTVERQIDIYKATEEFNDLATDSLIFILLQGLFDATPQANELHRNELDFLHTRANDKLKTVTDVLRGEVRQIVTDNMNVLKVSEIANLIKKRIEVSQTSAERIARTEITQAAQRASINTALAISSFTGQPSVVRWITVNDSKVRHLHAGWHGQKMTPAQAKKNSNISPWNCRCGLRVVTGADDTEKEQDMFNKERKFLLSKQSISTL